VSDGVLILAGATASGKTELALELAHTFDAEIVGADSRQVYRDMPIGTAAPAASALAAVPHHLVGFLDPNERYSAARFAIDAMTAIEDIRRRGKRALVVGGTGFYIRALTGGVELAPQYDAARRERLAREARIHDSAFLHAWLTVRDPARASALHPGDTYRVLRALEVALGRELTAERETPLPTLTATGTPFALLFLDVALEELDERIARRTEWMMENGLLEEAERIGADAVAASAVGYPQALAYSSGWCTATELRTTLERATRRYARRQRAWFRGESSAIWVTRDGVADAAREKLGWSAKPV
jgi:tRNA dimethylallyltransferase